MNIVPLLSQRDADARLAKSRANFEFYRELKESGTRLDWAATALFYSAVMLIDAHAIAVAGMSRNAVDVFNDHSDRNAYLETLSSQLQIAYLQLFRLSRKSRYRVGAITQDELERNEAEYRTVKREIAKKVKVDW